MKRWLFWPFLLLSGVLFGPYPAFALQVHPHPEGLIAHLIAHLFFAFAMGLFAYRIKKMDLLKRPHWRYLFYAGILLVIWNFWAFAGHLVALQIPKEAFLAPEKHEHFCRQSFSIKNYWELFYYLLKNDNLFTLPAFYFIYRALSRMESLLRGET